MTTSSRVVPLLVPVLLGAAAGAHAQGTGDRVPTMSELLERIDAQDRKIAELSGTSVGSEKTRRGTPLEAVYDGGFKLRSVNPDDPFELRINGRMQFRYAGFDADHRGSTSSMPAYRSDFEIERGRLEFRGTFLDKGTHFYINLDADTDDGHQVIFHDFWVNHQFSPCLDLYVGKAFVPGSRDWITGSTVTHLIDRSLATSFFRPDRSLGVWAIGEVAEDLHYRAMIANGFNTSDLGAAEVDNKFAYSGTMWWDPCAPYGSGYADLEQHEDLAMRVGASATFAPEEDGQQPANREADAIRLSNGNRLTAVGGEHFDVLLFAVDAALKFQGIAINSEFFHRTLDNIHAPTNAATQRSYEDWGGYVDVGYMIVPKTFEIVGRYSTIQGDLMNSYEYALGANYYLNGKHTNKLSFDVTMLDGSPVSSSGPNFRLGDDGFMFRAQWQIAF